MPRPETIEDIPENDRYQSIANVHLGNFSDDPRLIRIFADLTEAVLDIGGRVTGTSYVTMERPKTAQELEDTLRYAQHGWETTDARYYAILQAELTGSTLEPEYKDYEGYSLRKHARAEGLDILDTIAEKPKVDA